MCHQYWKAYIAAEGSDPFDVVEDYDLEQKLGIAEQSMMWSVSAARPSPRFAAYPSHVARENAIAAAKSLVAKHPELGDRVRAQYVDACGCMRVGEVTLTVDNNFEEPDRTPAIPDLTKVRIAKVVRVPAVHRTPPRSK
jgi:hypothetical protein